jgi:hypothetical protein
MSLCCQIGKGDLTQCQLKAALQPPPGGLPGTIRSTSTGSTSRAPLLQTGQEPDSPIQDAHHIPHRDLPRRPSQSVSSGSTPPADQQTGLAQYRGDLFEISQGKSLHLRDLAQGNRAASIALRQFYQSTQPILLFSGKFHTLPLKM